MPNGRSSERNLERLPVNPRRKKVAPNERKRVQTACNSCNVRRIKCTGNKPCAHCVNTRRDCIYPTPIVKISVSKYEYEDMKRQNAILREKAERVRPGALGDSPLPALIRLNRATSVFGYLHADSDPPGPDHDPTALIIDDPPGKLLSDPFGTFRFHGETSGATFLDCLKDFMATSTECLAPGLVPKFQQPVGSYHTHDSRPMVLPPDEFVDPFWLPPIEEARAIFSLVRNAIMDGNIAYPCGGILYWPVGDLEIVASAPRDPRHRRRLAFWNAVFAFGTLLQPARPGSRLDGRLGEAFYARTRILLGNPLDVHLWSFHDVPTLTIMALYHVENNRRDLATAFISTAMNICRMHGIDRGSNADPTELRIFWTLFALDRWLSCLMGRLPAYPADTLRLPLPQDCAGLPSAVGLRSYAELAYISNFLVHHSYRSTEPEYLEGEKPPLPEGIREAQRMLAMWYRGQPADMLAALQLDVYTFADVELQQVDYGNMDPAFMALQMAYHQLVILTIRPALLSAVRKAVAGGFLGEVWNIDNAVFSQETIYKCSESARMNLMLGHRLFKQGHRFLMRDLHHIFNAALIIILHLMIFLNVRTNDPAGVNFAMQVFTDERNTGNEYAADCLNVLTVLQQLMWELRKTVFGDDAREQAERERMMREAAAVPGALQPVEGLANNSQFDVRHGSEIVLALPMAVRRPSPPPVTPEMRLLLEDWKSRTEITLYKGGKVMIDG